ncbi:MAG: YARHG domain-containing protein [Nitrospirota bacterium]
MNKIATVIALLFFITATVWADGVEVSSTDGNTVIPVQNNKIRMVSEEVVMVPANTKGITEDVKVNATFLFENLTDQPISMKMGFPYFSSAPKSFKAWVQDKVVNIEKRPMGGKGEIVLQHERSGYILHMNAWDISFQPHEKKNVKVEYLGTWGFSLDRSTSYFIYVVETGALWSGTIGKADFSLILSESTMDYLKHPGTALRAYPSGYMRKGNRIEWHFQNWKPKENLGVVTFLKDADSTSADEGQGFFEGGGIVVTSRDEPPPIPDAMYRCAGYFKNKTRYEGNRRNYRTDELEHWYEDRFSDKDPMPRLCIKALRNEIYARHGRVFTTPEMKQIFEKSPWYKPKPDFKETDLNETEKKNVELIQEYEKKMGWH